jgi:hypothetical protein
MHVYTVAMVRRRGSCIARVDDDVLDCASVHQTESEWTEAFYGSATVLEHEHRERYSPAAAVVML